MDFREKTKSYAAINEYIHSCKQNQFRHNARVIVRCEGKILCNEILEVHASIETNFCFVDIDWDGEEENYYVRYTNDYQTFEFNNEVLIISAQDRNGNNIEIEIYS